MKHETKLNEMKALVVLAESATNPFSPQSARKKAREVRLALNRARQEKEEATRELSWALEQEEEAKVFRLDAKKKLEDATEKVAVEEAKLDDLEESSPSQSCLVQISSDESAANNAVDASSSKIKLAGAKEAHEASRDELKRVSLALRKAVGGDRAAQKQLTAERAADEAYGSAGNSRTGRANARAARNEVFLTPSRPGTKRDRKSKSTPKSVPKRSKIDEQKEMDNAISACKWSIPFQVEVFAVVMAIALVSLMLAVDQNMVASMTDLLSAYAGAILDSIVSFCVQVIRASHQLGDYTTNKTTSVTNAASDVLHNATFATKQLGRQALSEAFGISLLVRGNIMSAASSAVVLKDTVVDTTCAALQGSGK